MSLTNRGLLLKSLLRVGRYDPKNKQHGRNNAQATVAFVNQLDEELSGKTVSGAVVGLPGGISNNSGLMLGLSDLSSSNIITPKTSGRLSITICGVVKQSTTADGAFWHIRTGTGTPPINGGALAGTQSGCQQSMTFLTGVLAVPFSITAFVTGLNTTGVSVWIDLVLGTATGGTATMTQVGTTAFEF